MTRILRSVFAIAVVGVLAVGVSRAAFSDTEQALGISSETGTIDIAVDGQNPWSNTEEYSLGDLKPSFTDYIEFEIKNVGTNPANIWKTLSNYQFSDLVKSEPECVAEHGTWVNGDCTSEDENVFGFASAMNYDMRVELYDTNNNKVWWETIYLDSDNVTLSEINNQKMYLGMIPAGWSMKVIQSYHMPDSANVEQNQFQGDKMTFDITLYAEELTNEVTLVKKYEADSDLSHHLWNQSSAVFGYKVMDDQLRWTLDTLVVADGEYTLIVWDDSSDYDFAWPMNAVVLGYINDSGDDAHSGEIDLNHDLINAKVWLVPGHHGAGVGSIVTGFDWNALNEGTYFETGLIDYYDSLLP